MKPLADAFVLETEPAEPWFPMCGQGPDRGAAEPEPACGLAVERPELVSPLPADVAADVELDEFLVAPAELAEPPEVAATAAPAPAASPATATAPPIASLRSAPTELSPGMNALLCVSPAGRHSTASPASVTGKPRGRLPRASQARLNSSPDPEQVERQYRATAGLDRAVLPAGPTAGG
jgi:hypothetical protein